ncbi:MAG: hypothetical protein AAFU85_08710 [Planctomycetota bacterium]
MDADKIQNFIVHNFEKAVVVLVVGLSGFLVYAGMGKEDIMKSYDPKKLQSDATQVRASVDDDHTAKIVDPRVPNFDIAAEREKSGEDIDESIYMPRELWDHIKQEVNRERRKDPVLAKPSAILTQPVVGTIAFRSANGNYMLTTLEPADELEKVDAKRSRSRDRDQENDMMDMMGMSGMDEGMGGMMDMEGMMGGGMAPGGPGGKDSEDEGPIRTMDAEYNLGATAKETTSMVNGAEQKPVPGPGVFIAGTAVIPHKELIDSYQEALSNATGYDPLKRDRPDYIDYQVQRADITGRTVADLEEKDWIVRDSRLTTTVNAAQYWAGFAPEIVPADYVIPGTTMWIPPVLLDQYQHFAIHPLIPMKSQQQLQAEQALIDAKENQAPDVADEKIFDLNANGGGGGNFGGMGMDMMGGMGMDDMMGGGMGGMDMGMDMMGGGMGGGVTNAYAGKPAEEDPVDYKLLRFYDFWYIKGRKADPNAPKAGRTYVYRIRYGVNDPNFPEDEKLQPLSKLLDKEAHTRFRALAAKAKEDQARDYIRWSEWSEPSAPTRLKALDRSSFGSVKAEKSKRIEFDGRSVVLESSSPKAEVVASSFNLKYGVFVPTLIEAQEGTVLSKKVETADVVDPINFEIRKLEDTDTEPLIIRSTATIIDIEGGVPLEFVEDDEMVEPGLFLMMDASGKLKVRDSIEEQRVYRIQSFAKERGL